MKVLLIGFTKIKYMPYINFYLEQLVKKEASIDLVYWNRDLKPDIQLDPLIKLFEFNSYQEDEVPRFKKLFNFYKFRRYTKKILSSNVYDIVIVMHTIPAILLFDELIFKKRKFILDYRDATFERFTAFRNAVNRLIDYSELSFTSSDAFRTHFNNNDKVITTHNILKDVMFTDQATVNMEIKDFTIEPIIIRYWGFIRHEEVNLRLINQLGGDSRFELHYHGREQQTAINLKKHVNSNAFENIYFHGEYIPSERLKFLEETDIIHNVFDNDSTMGPALSNKFYDAVFNSIPQICNIDTHMGKIVKENYIGYSWDYSENLPDNLYNFILSKNESSEMHFIKLREKLSDEYNQASDSLWEILNGTDI